MAPNPFEAARQRQANEQSVQERRLAELRAALRHHDSNLNSQQADMFGLSGQIWTAETPQGNFDLDTDEIERFITTGEPGVYTVVQTVLELAKPASELTEAEQTELLSLKTAAIYEIIIHMDEKGFVDAAKQVLPKKIADSLNCTLDYHQFSALKRAGFTLPKELGRHGVYLSQKGRKAAAWLRRNPQLR